MTPLQLLERTAIEARISTGFYGSTDRILSTIDAARCTLSPAAKRTPAMHSEAMAAQSIVLRELAKTILHTDLDEQHAYDELRKLGETIHFGELRHYLSETIARLRQQEGQAST